MVRWGNPPTQRWRCPPCSQIRRDDYHDKTALGAPQRQTVESGVYLQDSDLTLYHGDALNVLSSLPDESVHMCATSPPFHALRDYGVGGQIGLEPTVEEWCDRLVEVFRELRRVLRADGTLWIEIGDSFSQKQLVGQPWLLAFALKADGWFLRSEIIWEKPNAMPESIKDRPTRSHSTVLLFSKQARYYFDADAIRQAYSDNTHSKGQGIGVKMEVEQEAGTMQAGRNNASFGNATQRSHVDLARLRPQTETLDGSEGEAERGPDGRRVTHVKAQENSHQYRDGERWPNPEGANARSVWSVPTEPTPFAHFATWPRKLVARMIAAGTSERGCCGECGAPHTRDVEVGDLVGNDRGGNYRGSEDAADAAGANRFAAKNEYRPGMSYERMTRGWLPSCDHDAPVVPCVVLDPFAGSGTTLFVARAMGRHSVGIELNEDYAKLVVDRTQQLSLLT